MSESPPPPGSPTAQLRKLLNSPGIIRSLGAHDVFSAMLVEQAGFETVFVGGFGVSASLLGLPDLNFLTLTEMTDHLRRLCARVSIPVIADGDTGHGDLPQVQRTVRAFESAGAAGIILEDQVAPKRCGHFEGKEIIPAEEMALKLRAAAAARQNPEFVIVGRTDARDVAGLDEAIRRANLFARSGADVAFVEAPATREELERVASEVKAPLLVNMLWGGKTPILRASELEKMGFKIAVAPIESLLVTARAVRDLAETFLRDGTVEVVQDRMVGFGEVKSLLGVDRFLHLRDNLDRA